ncbi:MAG: DNA-directed RNA polymerase subunit beta [Caldisericia bacterium]
MHIKEVINFNNFIFSNLEIPDLLEYQKESFFNFVNEKIAKLLDEISPVVTPKAEVEFFDPVVFPPELSVDECKERKLTYSGTLKAKVRITNKRTGEIKEQEVFLGEIPYITPYGSFVFNGAERVVVSQLIRSPGVYFTKPSSAHSGRVLFEARLIPERGTWFIFEIETNNTLVVRLNKGSRKLYFPTILRVFQEMSDEEIMELFKEKRRIKININEIDKYLPCTFAENIYDSSTGEVVFYENEEITKDKVDILFSIGINDVEIYKDVVDNLIKRTLEKDTNKTQEDAILDIYRKLRPGERVLLESAKNLIHVTFFDTKRNYLSDVGRHKINQRFGFKLKDNIVRLEDIIAIIRHAVKIKNNEAPLDNIDHLGNRYVRGVGELMETNMRYGLLRMIKVMRGRISTYSEEMFTAQHIVNSKPITAALQSFFGTGQLSQFMEQTNPLSSITHKRRLSSMGPGGLTRETAGLEVRDIHSSHYGRICPIETPEGQNIGLINSLTIYAKVNKYGFITTPYRKVKNGKLTDEIFYLEALEEENFYIAQANTPVNKKGELLKDDNGRLLNDGFATGRFQGEVLEKIPLDKIQFMEISPLQVFSVSASLIPFLEHDDANRALMGCNMQRQAVPLLFPEPPIIATGVEKAVAKHDPSIVISDIDGVVKEVSGDKIVIKGKKEQKVYELKKFSRSNQDTAVNTRPIVRKNDKISKGDIIADGQAIKEGILSLGRNVLIAYLPWRGYNYQDAILISERLVKDDTYTSVHIKEYITTVRETKAGPEILTRDIPNVDESELRNLTEEGIVRLGAEVKPGDILVGKLAPKVELDTSPESKIWRAMFGEKGRDVVDNSLRLPPGEFGTVILTKIYARDKGDELPVGIEKLVKVLVAQKRKVMIGDKMAGRHGNKGVVAAILPEEDMPYTKDGTPIDIVLSPLSVPSRMNIGQTLETMLGYAAYKLGLRFEIPIFSQVKEKDIEDILRKAGINIDSKEVLYDGYTGEPFKSPALVGYAYFMKLNHLVLDKVHARSTGTYSLVTQQPLGGKSQFGGQRLGEMEVWALEAYGAANLLQEMLTVKSDDIDGRRKAYESIVKGKDIEELGIPESFKVLVRELRGLGINIRTIPDLEKKEEKKELKFFLPTRKRKNKKKEVSQ